LAQKKKQTRKGKTIPKSFEEFRKLDRYDIALFSISSIVGLVFTIIILVLGEIGALIFLPTLIVGWFMPFYVWYKGGALSKSLIQRVRGMAYFFTSIVLYALVAIITASGFFEATLSPNKIVEQIIIVFVISFLSLFAIYMINIKLLLKKIYGCEISPRDNKIIYKTTSSAIVNAIFLLASFTFLYLGYHLLPYFTGYGIASLLWGVCLLISGIINLISTERDIRKIVGERIKA